MTNLLTGAFLNFAGPVTVLAFFLWAWSMARFLLPRWRAGWRGWAVTSAYALGGTAIAFLSATVGFKVLSDETNLLSVANMLALFGKASNTEMWTYYYHTYHAIVVSVPSRPILFPVLTALVEAVVGVRYWAPFVVNFFCLFGLFFLVLHWAKKKGVPRPVSFLSLLMSPILLIVSTSAGFDLCSVFFGALACLLLEKYLDEKTEEAFLALVFSALCFASVRYESIVALPILFAGLWLAERGRPIRWKVWFVAGALCLPLLVQRLLTWGTFENPPGVAPFSAGHFADHFLPFLQAFFLDGNGPYPVLLHWLGLGGLFFLFRKPRPHSLIPLAYGLFLFVILLAHHFGFAAHPTQARLFLPLTVGLCALGLSFLARMEMDSRWVCGIFFLLFLHHHQYTLLDPLSTQLTMTREVRYLRDFLGEEGKRSDLYVYDRPGQLMALGESAISWDYFKQHREEYLTNLRNKLYGRILAIERVKYNSPPEEYPLVKEGYTLTPLLERQLGPVDRLRLSRVEAR